MIARHADDERSCLLLALDGDAVVGMLDFSGHARAQQRHVGSFGMSVARAAAGAASARACCGAVRLRKGARLPAARARGVRDRRTAIVLYESQGSVHDGRRRGAVMVGEETVDCC